MNAAQKVILAVGGIVLLANLVYPPWESRRCVAVPNVVVIQRMARAPVLTPPQVLDNYADTTTTQIDWLLLGGTSLPIVAATGILMGLASSRKKPRPN